MLICGYILSRSEQVLETNLSPGKVLEVRLTSSGMSLFPELVSISVGVFGGHYQCNLLHKRLVYEINCYVTSIICILYFVYIFYVLRPSSDSLIWARCVLVSDHVFSCIALLHQCYWMKKSDWFIDLLIYRLIFWFFDWFIDWLIDLFIYLFIYLFIDLLIDWLIDWLIDRVGQWTLLSQ